MTVLLFTWFCYTKENPGIIFVAMNYSVHAIMYGYYFLVRDPFLSLFSPTPIVHACLYPLT